MAKNGKKFWRQVHYWLAIAVALQFLVMLGSGGLLLLKKDVGWIQPPTQRGVGETPELSYAQVLEIAQGVPEAEIASWEDIDRLDVRPGKGMLKVRALSGYEIQLDTQTGEILQVAYRRSDLIESIHDGSFFHDYAKLGIILPTAGILLILWATGIYLFILPFRAKAKKRRKEREKALRQLEPLS